MTATHASQPLLVDGSPPLSETVFVVVDLETTGSSEADQVTEIGAVKVSGGHVLGEFHSLVNPARHIPAVISVLTGITDSMVAHSPTMDQVLPSFLQFVQGSVLVAHNARFDVGFLRRACEVRGTPWPAPTVLDTVPLARQALLRDEVPNVKLATLARHFRASVTPEHRALADARATVDVLHGLFERLGSLGVHTVEEAIQLCYQVTPQQRHKRTWAKDLPEDPGVYCFVRADPSQPREVLYVGKATNLRRRVATYFTASEKRRRMAEMIAVATGVEVTRCASALEAEVTELRLIAAHAPRYNRRSKYPNRVSWLTLTDEPFPRLSIVKEPGSRSVWGPVRNRGHGSLVCHAIYATVPLRQCTDRLSATSSPTTCALAGLGTCAAPCEGQPGYHEVVEHTRSLLQGDVRPAIEAHAPLLQRLSQQLRFEEAAAAHRRLDTLLDFVYAHHRRVSLTRCPELVAAQPVDAPSGRAWDIHVIRFGRLAAAGHCAWGQDPRAFADNLVATAETVPAPVGDQTVATVEETHLISNWLEQPGIRFLETNGDWAWPFGLRVPPARLRQLLGDAAAEPMPADFQREGHRVETTSADA